MTKISLSKFLFLYSITATLLLATTSLAQDSEDQVSVEDPVVAEEDHYDCYAEDVNVLTNFDCNHWCGFQGYYTAHIKNFYFQGLTCECRHSADSELIKSCDGVYETPICAEVGVKNCDNNGQQCAQYCMESGAAINPEFSRCEVDGPDKVFCHCGTSPGVIACQDLDQFGFSGAGARPIESFGTLIGAAAVMSTMLLTTVW